MASYYFPPAKFWSREGIVAVGGNLNTERLLDAYRHGIFPWPISAFEQILWWSPHPRAILPLDGFIASKRLLRRVRSGQFEISSDRAFAQVIRGCQGGPGREEGTWITEAMVDGYIQLHRLGNAHSVEVWQKGELVGGVYGVTIGGLFAAESMFHRVRDASKVALFHLVQHLNHRKYQLLDVQQWTPHTASLGVVEIPRAEYFRRLAAVVDLPISFGTEIEMHSR